MAPTLLYAVRTSVAGFEHSMSSPKAQSALVPEIKRDVNEALQLPRAQSSVRFDFRRGVPKSPVYSFQSDVAELLVRKVLTQVDCELSVN
ncbi:hypothetical protein D3C87_1937660 [compost metagenome]